MKEFDIHDYSDIIDLPHHTSQNRPKMTNIERGAQFSPIAALTGYEAAVEEAGRITDEQRELAEDMKSIIDSKLKFIFSRIDEHPEIEVTHFVPDRRKAGGKYVRTEGRIKRIDEYGRCVIMAGGEKIDIDCIHDIDGDIFKNF